MTVTSTEIESTPIYKSNDSAFIVFLFYIMV